MAVVFDHAVSMQEVPRHPALTLHRRTHVREQMHAGGVHPAEERPIGANLPPHEIHRGIR